MIPFLLTIQATTLYMMGRYVYKPENPSGGIGDWYTLSHFLHGLLFGWFTLPVAVFIEVVWEIVENTPWVINKYRKGGHPDYNGDSIVNSLFDTFACICGWYFANTFPWEISLATLVMSEIVMYIFIKDNLLLNILVVLGLWKKN